MIPKNQEWTPFNKHPQAGEIAKGLGSIPPNWALTPVREKKPYRTNWQNEVPLKHEVIVKGLLEGNSQISKKGNQYTAFDSGYGLRLGDISNGLLGIDFDGLSSVELLMGIEGYQTLPKTISWTSGKEGRQQILFQIPPKYRNKLESFTRLSVDEYKDFKCEEKEQLEFRYNDCQSVLPPSHHPETGSYHWIESPENTEVAECPQWLLSFLLSQPEKNNNNTTTKTMENPYDKYLAEQSLPIAEAIPLESCLAPKSRELLTGVAEGARDATGAAIARDLIGTADYLNSIGQKYEGAPMDFLEMFCQSCTPSLSSRDCEKIYRSAEKDNPLPCLDPEKIENNIKAWYWHNSNIKDKYYKNNRNNSYSKSNNNNIKKKISLETAVTQAQEVLLREHDEITTNLMLENIRTDANIPSYTWDNKFVKPLKKQVKEKKLKLEISVYINETDVFKKVQLKQKICSNYCLSGYDLKLLADHLESQQSIPEKTVYTFEEFLNLESSAEDWIVPSLIPVGEMLLLTALPKVGKSLLATDIAYSVLSGTKTMGETATQGKVLYISSDESPRSLNRRFQSRSFDLLGESKENLRVMTHLDLTNLSTLEEQLEDFRPELVVIDSLTSVTLNLGISENDQQFAKYVYKLKDLFKKYNSASILIHHENKNSDAKGIGKVSGSARIPAAVWGVAQLSGGDTIDDSGEDSIVKGQNIRYLDLLPREGQKVKYSLEINPKAIWGERGIFKFLGETDDPNGTKRSQADQVLELLTRKAVPLEYSEIDEILGIGRSLYTVLDRLGDRQLINRRRSKANPRRWVYFINDFNHTPNPTPDEKSSQEDPVKKHEEEGENFYPPSPSCNTSENFTKNSKTIMDKEFDISQQVSQQLVNTTKIVNLGVNSSNQDTTMDEALSQHFSTNRGGGGEKNIFSTPEIKNTNCQEEEIIDKGVTEKSPDIIADDNSSDSSNNPQSLGVKFTLEELQATDLSSYVAFDDDTEEMMECLKLADQGIFGVALGGGQRFVSLSGLEFLTFVRRQDVCVDTEN